MNTLYFYVAFLSFAFSPSILLATSDRSWPEFEIETHGKAEGLAQPPIKGPAKVKLPFLDKAKLEPVTAADFNQRFSRATIEKPLKLFKRRGDK